MMARCRLPYTLIFLFALTFVAGGCGRKTMVVPPQSVVPVAVNDLSFALTEKGVVLSWSFPRRTTHGATLSSIDSFELLRAEVPVEDYCGGCPQPFGPPTTIQGGPLSDDSTGRQARFEDTSLRPGHQYVYVVRSRAGWRGASSVDSNSVSFVWKKPHASAVPD